MPGPSAYLNRYHARGYRDGTAGRAYDPPRERNGEKDAYRDGFEDARAARGIPRSPTA